MDLSHITLCMHSQQTVIPLTLFLCVQVAIFRVIVTSRLQTLNISWSLFSNYLEWCQVMCVNCLRVEYMLAFDFDCWRCDFQIYSRDTGMSLYCLTDYAKWLEKNTGFTLRQSMQPYLRTGLAPSPPRLTKIGTSCYQTHWLSLFVQSW